LKDAARPSRVKPLSPEAIEQVVHMTLHQKPPNATHWSMRSMAVAAGIPYTSVQRTRGTGPRARCPMAHRGIGEWLERTHPQRRTR
jgi:hypothetical protein